MGNLSLHNCQDLSTDKTASGGSCIRVNWLVRGQRTAGESSSESLDMLGVEVLVSVCQASQGNLISSVGLSPCY